MSFSNPVAYENAIETVTPGELMDYVGPSRRVMAVMEHNPYYFDDSQVVLKASPFT